MTQLDYFAMAVDLVRGEAATEAAPYVATSHWIEYDAEQIGHQQRAACGNLVSPDAFSTEPSCLECQRQMANIEAMVFE